MPRTLDPPAIALLAALGAVALLGGLCVRLLVDRGRLLLHLDEAERAAAGSSRRGQGLPPGSFPSDFALPRLASAPDAAGGNAIVTLSSLVGPPLLLVFLQTDCLYSRAFAHELAATEPAPDAPMPVSIVIGELGDADSLFTHLPGIVLLDPHGQVARLMRVTATPSGYRVDATRRTVGPLIDGPGALLAALRNEPAGEAAEPLALTPVATRPSSNPEPLPLEAAAPDFTLPSLAGAAWSLSAQRGRPVLLILSDPGCAPCHALLTQLGRRDQTDIAIVSRGGVEENRRLAKRAGITAPVLLQQRREVARLYRTLETPAAFLISAEGTIAAGPVVGNEAVLALLSRSDLRYIPATCHGIRHRSARRSRHRE